MANPEGIENNLKEYVERAKKHPSGFAPLYDAYFEQIYRFILKRVCDLDEAGDLTQRTFIKAMKAIQRYEVTGAPFSSWLYRIASNEVNMFFRRKKKVVNVEITQNDVVSIMEEIEIGGGIDVTKVMLEVLDDLKEEQKDIIEMRFFQKLSFSEIAEVLEISEANAKMKVYRTLKRMRKLMVKRGVKTQ